MATITYRGPGAWGSGYGSALTILQVDTNFYNLNENKLEKGDNLSGLTNKSTARTNLDLGGLPAVTSSGASNEYLKGDGSWGIPPTNPGTVTSVSGSGSVAGLTLSGTVTSSGNITLGGTLSVSLTSNVSGTLQIANGGTGATTPGGALSNIGAAASVHGHSASDINSGQLSISRMPRGTSGYLLQASGTSADPAWVATSGISVNYATSAGSATSASSATTAGSCSGNAGTATKWQTARTLTIGSTGKYVDGSANVSWSLADIGAAASVHGHSASDINSGQLSMSHMPRGTSGYLLQASGTSADPAWVATSGISVNHATYSTSATAALSAGSANYATSAGSASSATNATNANYATSAGSASSATKWQTARTLTIGSTGKYVDGSANVSWSLAEIGAAATSHSHDTNSGISKSDFSQVVGTFRLTNFFGSQAAPGGVGIYFKNNYSNVAGMLYAAQGACGLMSDSGLTYAAPYHTWFVNKEQEMYLDSGYLRPYTRYGLSLGASGFEWNQLYISQVVCNGTVICGSDLRLKTNVKPSDLGLDFVLKLNPVKFNWISDVEKNDPNIKNNYGFIAQEVEELLNDPSSSLYKYDSEHDKYFLAYDHFIAPLTKAIQEQQEIINNLKARIEALEAK